MTELDRDKEKLNLGRKIVIFIGPEGSGKTIQARRLAKESGKPYITTGDIIRDLAANDPGPLGEECREMFASHGYLDGASLLKILAHRFSQADVADGLVLDGGLRTLEETVDFTSMLAEAGLNLPVAVVHLRVPGWMSFERLAFGEAARKRKDDTTRGVMSRLSKYYDRLSGRVGLIEKTPNWRLVHVDATAPIETVYSEVVQKLSRGS